MKLNSLELLKKFTIDDTHYHFKHKGKTCYPYINVFTISLFKKGTIMLSTYQDYVTLLSVYTYTKEKSNDFETELYTPSKELKNEIKVLMCQQPLLWDILDKESRIEKAFKYLASHIHTKKFSEEKFYTSSKATFNLTDKDKEEIINIVIDVSNENSKISIQEKDIGRHIAHYLFNKKEFFELQIKKQDIINNLLDFSKYNKGVYFQLLSLASIYIILKDYYPKYETVILNPNQTFYNQLEDLFLNVPVLTPIIDKNIVIKESIIVLQSCIDKTQMRESKFFHYMKSLKENLSNLDKENFLLAILEILSLDGVITRQEEIFFSKLTSIINFSPVASKKLMDSYKVKKIYKIKWDK
jgi:PII-like signaling protein